MSAGTPPPIISHAEWRRLTPPGFLGLPGSVFNPGAVVFNGRLLVVGRGEEARPPRHLHDTASPIWLDVDDTGTVVGHRRTARARIHPRWRLEDFRLFTYRGGLYSNHAMIRRGLRHWFPRLSARMSPPAGTPGLSRVDPETGRFDLLGPMHLDRPCARYEKNWVLFADGDRLLLIYSLSPYRLFELDQWSTRRFRLLIEADSVVPADADGRLSSSANPIAYDADHYLGMCHCHDRGGIYHTWAIKISRASLRPVAVTDRPVLAGGQATGKLSNVVYPMAVTADEARVRFFFGEGDVACGWAELPRERLERHFVAPPRR